MTYRERVIGALEHEPTDLTPWNFELTREFAARLKSETGCSDESDCLQCHIMYGRFKRTEWIAADTYEDMFGVRWKIGTDGGDIGAPCNRVMPELGSGTYEPPEVDGRLIQAAAKEMAADRERFRMFRLTYALFERAWSLAGMEELLAGMLAAPAAAAALLERITEFNLRVLDAILPHEFEGVYVGDDWGTQQGLIMGPDLWRRFIKPPLALMFEKIRHHGKYILVHSCGNIAEVLPDLIEIGMDAYNTVQPEIYDLAELKQEFGKDLTFWGGISTQQFLPFATPEEVRETSARVIRLLGNGGGYIFAPTHAVTPDIPVENLQAMLESVRSVSWNG